jgi:hypothetical protein
VYGYAAVAKLSADWLSGLTVKQMVSMGPMPRLAPEMTALVLQEPWIMGWCGFGIDVCLTFAVFFPTTLFGKLTLVGGTGFHLGNHFFFHLEAFPWVMISSFALLVPESLWSTAAGTCVAANLRMGTAIPNTGRRMLVALHGGVRKTARLGMVMVAGAVFVVAVLVRCAFFGKILHSRMPLDPTPACLKRADV